MAQTVGLLGHPGHHRRTPAASAKACTDSPDHPSAVTAAGRRSGRGSSGGSCRRPRPLCHAHGTRATTTPCCRRTTRRVGLHVNEGRPEIERPSAAASLVGSSGARRFCAVTASPATSVTAHDRVHLTHKQQKRVIDSQPVSVSADSSPAYGASMAGTRSDVSLGARSSPTARPWSLWLTGSSRVTAAACVGALPVRS